MRNLVVIAVLLALVAGAEGQGGDKSKVLRRYGIDQDTKKYPQATPKEALGSVIKALADQDVRYLMAHLADPGFVDKRVAMFAAQMSPKLSEEQKQSLGFDKLVQRTQENFQDDPTKFKELQRFQKDGEWDEADTEAVAKVKNIQARKVFMKKIGDRWVLQDREK
jgi:hypothetical protein